MRKASQLLLRRITNIRNIMICTLILSVAVITCCKKMDENVMSKEELKAKLTQLQYRVTQENGTEAPFQNEYWNNKSSGIYVDIISGEPLFSSKDKFDSGTGWPSFSRSIARDNIVTHVDKSQFMTRTEVRSKKANSHLGHVFEDCSRTNGLRYCINSASMRFIPVESLDKEGYGEFTKLFDKENKKAFQPENSKEELATFAAGCFWGVESILSKIEGVFETTVGYTGGHLKNPTYELLCTGRTGHAEAVLIKYDPGITSYEKLLDYFWRLHDPTTLNRQGYDVGTQYRSAIFYHNEVQREAAKKSKADFDISGVFKKKAVTEIVPATTFYNAEEYHQDYYVKNNKLLCHVLRDN